MDYFKQHLIEIIIIIVWLIILIIIFRQYFGKKIYGQFSEDILKLETQDYILVGKPDRVLEKFGNIIIYEFKSGKTPIKPYEDHIIQLGAYFILFEERYQRKPDYGIIKYKDKEYRIENSEQLRGKVQNLITEYLDQTTYPESIIRNHRNYGKCHNCQHRVVCKQSLVR